MGKNVWIAELSTQNFEFRAVGATSVEALLALRLTWEQHRKDYRATSSWEQICKDYGTPCPYELPLGGLGSRDGEPLKRT